MPATFFGSMLRRMLLLVSAPLMLLVMRSLAVDAFVGGTTTFGKRFSRLLLL
jgi:hypothetical protein